MDYYFVPFRCKSLKKKANKTFPAATVILDASRRHDFSTLTASDRLYLIGHAKAGVPELKDDSGHKLSGRDLMSILRDNNLKKKNGPEICVHACESGTPDGIADALSDHLQRSKYDSEVFGFGLRVKVEGGKLSGRKHDIVGAERGNRKAHIVPKKR